MAAALDLTGVRYGRLTVLRLGHPGGKKRRWICACDCGQEVLAGQDALRRGAHVSCGCARGNHGMSRTRVYHIWQGMIRRCTDPRVDSWLSYGGRGIAVCQGWLSFERFFADMGEPPSDNHTLERKKNDDGYHPSNCRWATPMQQAANTRRNVYVEYRGDRKCIAAWAREYGIGRERLRQRLLSGWPINLALTLPCNKRFQMRAGSPANAPASI